MRREAASTATTSDSSGTKLPGWRTQESTALPCASGRISASCPGASAPRLCSRSSQPIPSGSRGRSIGHSPVDDPVRVDEQRPLPGQGVGCGKQRGKGAGAGSPAAAGQQRDACGPAVQPEFAQVLPQPGRGLRKHRDPGPGAAGRGAPEHVLVFLDPGRAPTAPREGGLQPRPRSRARPGWFPAGACAPVPPRGTGRSCTPAPRAISAIDCASAVSRVSRMQRAACASRDTAAAPGFGRAVVPPTVPGAVRRGCVRCMSGGSGVCSCCNAARSAGYSVVPAPRCGLRGMPATNRLCSSMHPSVGRAPVPEAGPRTRCAPARNAGRPVRESRGRAAPCPRFPEPSQAVAANCENVACNNSRSWQPTPSPSRT